MKKQGHADRQGAVLLKERVVRALLVELVEAIKQKDGALHEEH